MELNSIIFPSPDLSHDVTQHEDEIIYIPKFSTQNKRSEEKITGYIPCLLLQSSRKNLISRNYLIYFHGNAEDIFFARDIADRMRANLSVIFN